MAVKVLVGESIDDSTLEVYDDADVIYVNNGALIVAVRERREDRNIAVFGAGKYVSAEVID